MPSSSSSYVLSARAQGSSLKYFLRPWLNFTDSDSTKPKSNKISLLYIFLKSHRLVII